MLYTLNNLLNLYQSTLTSKTAIIDAEERLSYGELLHKTKSFAAILQAKGLRKGDRVAIYLKRSIPCVLAYFATLALGGVAVFINDVLKAKQVNYILKHCGASLLITDSRLRLSLSNLDFNDDNIINIEKVNPIAGKIQSIGVLGSDLAMIIYTSGSTGHPKGIMLSHANLLSGTYTVSDYLKLTEDDILICLLPFSFDYGLNQVLTSLLVGATMVIQRSLFPPDICRTLTRQRVTGMAGVPLLWQQLVQSYSPFTKMSFPHLRYITNTGGRMPENIVKAIRLAHQSVEIYLMYGLTEAFRSTCLPPDQVDMRPNSIGKAIPNVEILVLNEEGKICDANEVGELVHRGANISMGYWRDPEATAKVFRPYPFDQGKNGKPEMVVYSGDYVKKDESAYLYFVGRKDKMIKSHGIRVSPEEIEECIYSSDLVSSVVAFDIKKNEVENNIIVAITPKQPSSFREEMLHEYCKQEMPEYLRPKIIWCLEQIPQTSSGKPDRTAIKNTYDETYQRI